MGKIGENFGVEPDKSQKQERGDRRSKDEGRKSSLRLTDGQMSFVLRGDIVKDDSGSYAVFTEQGSSASQMTAAKVMDIISGLPGCDGQAADAISAYTQVKNGGCSKITENSQIRMSRHLDSSTTTQMAKIMVQYGRPSRSA